MSVILNIVHHTCTYCSCSVNVYIHVQCTSATLKSFTSSGINGST
jgi:hypothetical protein